MTDCEEADPRPASLIGIPNRSGLLAAVVSVRIQKMASEWCVVAFPTRMTAEMKGKSDW